MTRSGALGWCPLSTQASSSRVHTSKLRSRWILGATVVFTSMSVASICGDIDQDGQVTVLDASVAALIVAGEVEATLAQELSGDVNGDGRIGAVDMLMIADLSVGAPVETRCLSVLLLTEECHASFAIQADAVRRVSALLEEVGVTPLVADTLPAEPGAHRLIIDMRFTSALDSQEWDFWDEFLAGGRGGAWFMAGAMDDTSTRGFDVARYLRHLGGQVNVHGDRGAPAVASDVVAQGFSQAGPVITSNAGWVIQPDASGQILLREPGSGAIRGLLLPAGTLGPDIMQVAFTTFMNRCLTPASEPVPGCPPAEAFFLAMVEFLRGQP